MRVGAVPGLVLATLFGASALSAQGVIGIVIDTESHRPVAGVEVVLQTDSGAVAASAVTDQEGRFFFAIGERGTYAVIASSLGYHTNTGSNLELEDTGMTWVEIELAPDAIEIPGLTVVTQQKYVSSLARRGYYTRKRQSLGRFIEPTEFEQKMHVPFRELLRRTAFFGRMGCEVGLIVNGMRSFHGISDDPRLRARYIAGIELYRAAGTAPAQFRAMVPTACALIVVWLDFTDEN